MHGKFPSFRLKGDLIHVYKNLKGGCREEGARLFSQVLGDRTRGDGSKWKHRKISQHQETFFPLRVTKHWHRLHRELWNLHAQRCFKAVWTWNWATGSEWSCLSRGLGQVTFRVPCQPQPVCDAEICWRQFSLVLLSKSKP